MNHETSIQGPEIKLWRCSGRFQDKTLEETYVEFHILPQLEFCRRCGSFLALLFGAYWLALFSKEHRILPGIVSLHDKSPGIFLSGMALMSTVALGLLGVMKWPKCLNNEVTTVILAGIMPITALCASRYHSAALIGADPWEHWNMIGFCFTDSVILLSFNVLVSGCCLLMKLRCCALFPLILFIPSCYMVFCLHHGSPYGRGVEISNNSMLFFNSLICFLGRRRLEVQERQLFARAQGLSANVSHLQENVFQLEARLHAMHALMGTVCEVVFHAGENLRVVESNTRLNDLLGDMQGKCLTERMADSEQIERRFQRVVAALLAAPLKNPGDTSMGHGDAPGVVLVPPLTFKRQAQPRVDAQTSNGIESDKEEHVLFDAEILVADTGVWHESGAKAWRYLVGLKSLRPHRAFGSRAAENIREVDTRGHVEHIPCSSDPARSQMDIVSVDSSARSNQSRRSSPSNHTQLLDTIREEGFSLTPTPFQTICFGLQQLMTHWHLPESDKSPEGLKNLVHEALENLASDGHLSMVQELTGGQCRMCKSLLAVGRRECSICDLPALDPESTQQRSSRGRTSCCRVSL